MIDTNISSQGKSLCLVDVQEEAVTWFDFSNSIVVEDQFGYVVAIVEGMARKLLNSVSTQVEPSNRPTLLKGIFFNDC